MILLVSLIISSICSLLLVSFLAKTIRLISVDFIKVNASTLL